MSRSAGCGKKLEVFVPSGKMIIVKCGNTSPSGEPWQCEECEKLNADRDWRKEAVEAGEVWSEDDY